MKSSIQARYDLSKPNVQLLGALFAVSAASIGFEIMLTRYFAIASWSEYGYWVISIVMVGLALPFAYLNARSGGVSMKVFVGIMLGVSFVLLNNVFRHLGLLGNWTPWIVAATPGALYLALSLAAFGWLVRFR